MKRVPNGPIAPPTPGLTCGIVNELLFGNRTSQVRRQAGWDLAVATMAVTAFRPSPLTSAS